MPLSASHLVLSQVGKRFQSEARPSRAVLGQVNLELQAGEIGAIVGASGCGKSTLLRIVAGLATADSGEAHFQGAPIRGPHPSRGFVFQEHRLFPWLTVAQNVAFGLRHLPTAARQAKIDLQLDRVGLMEFHASYPAMLSGGMAQRVALARALAPEPQLLLLDEPFAALDAFTKVHLQTELLRLQRTQGCSALLVTHDVEEAVFLADRVHILAGRPGTIRRSIEVNLPHPRDRTSEGFSQLRRQVLDELRRHVESNFTAQSFPEPALQLLTPDPLA